MTALITVLAVLGVLALFVIGVYNKLVGLRNRVKEAWSGIDTQLKRRYDLIPNLVETVKGYAKHEKGVFEEVTKARSQAMQAQTPAEHAKAENMLTQTLKSLFAVAENYPDLKANENFMNLQDTLNMIEDEINKARRYYNAIVRDYNTAQEVFPNNIVAGMFGFKKEDFFEAAEEEKKNVKVTF